MLGAGWHGNGSNIDMSRRQEGEVRHRLNKILGLIRRRNRLNIYVSRRQEREVRLRLNEVFDFILSRQRVFIDD